MYLHYTTDAPASGASPKELFGRLLSDSLWREAEGDRRHRRPKTGDRRHRRPETPETGNTGDRRHRRPETPETAGRKRGALGSALRSASATLRKHDMRDV